MTVQTLIRKLKELQKKSVGDCEHDHAEADKLLLEYISNDSVIKAYDDIKKFYA